jgi:hypothetical protein
LYTPASKQDFEELLRGVRKGLVESMKALTDVSQLETVRDELQRDEAHLHLAGGQAHLHLDAYTLLGAPEQRRLVMLAALTADGDTLADVLASFQR